MRNNRLARCLAVSKRNRTFLRGGCRFAATSAGVIALCASSASAQVWRFTSSLAVEETLTNNVKLESNATRRSDFVSQITPTFGVIETGAHTSLAAQVSLPILLYARTGSENNTVTPEVSVLGRVEAIPRFFFVEGAVSVSQQYLSPFGARSPSLANATNNRYTSESYRVSPYIQGVAGPNLTYTLRDDVTWTNANRDQNLVGNGAENHLHGNVTRSPTPFGWAADIDRNDTHQAGQDSVQSIARVFALYRIDPQVEVSSRVGYEHDDYGLTMFDNAIYGAGLTWRPTDRTNVAGWWEHRFFGTGYSFDFSHRTPLTVWTVRASRDTTTYPQQLANLPVGGDVQALLNQLFVTRIPDPAQRTTIVNQFIADRGLPATLAAPIALLTQRVTLQESLLASVGLLGARNSVFVSAYRQRNEPIGTPDEVLPPELFGLQNNTQYGAGVVWSHQIAPLVTLTAHLDGSRTLANGSATGSTRQVTAQAIVTTKLSARTSTHAGVRYQLSRSDVGFDYDEAAIFAGLTYQLR
jgi:uncharacterized protein (PEP-CTERM system associated)